LISRKCNTGKALCRFVVYISSFGVTTDSSVIKCRRISEKNWLGGAEIRTADLEPSNPHLLTFVISVRPGLIAISPAIQSSITVNGSGKATHWPP